MKIKYLIYAAILIVVGYLIYNRVQSNKSQAAATSGTAGKGAKMPPISVNGVVVTPQHFDNTLSVSGSIEANEQVQIRTEISGIVKTIFFKEGTLVNKGDMLIKINDDELQAQLLQATTKENLAKENEYRSKMLLQKEAISQQEYDATLADLKSLQAQTQLIKAQLSKASIRAPFSGKIGLRSISEGEYVTSATVITSLVNANPVKITFSIPEKYANRIPLNTKLTFTTSSSTEVFNAQVFAIEPSINIATRTIQLKALANNSGGKLLPGSFAKIDLPLSSIKDALLVPTEAIVPVLKGKKVFIMENGLAKDVEVETTARTEKDVLVSAGIKPGDTVLTTGIMSLKTGMPVKVTIVNR